MTSIMTATTTFVATKLHCHLVCSSTSSVTFMQLL